MANIAGYLVFRLRAWLAARIAPADPGDAQIVADVERVRRPSGPRLPPVEWSPLADPFDARLCYHDQDGVVTERRIRVIADGIRPGRDGDDVRYIKAMDYADGRRTKTFRVDRIETLERLGKPR